MRAVLSIIGGRSGEVLDLTAPATDTDGFVARWLREAMARDAAEPAFAPRHQAERTAS